MSGHRPYQELRGKLVQRQQAHKNVSYVKSVFRIIGYTLLLGPFTAGLVMLVTAELLGILEEAVGA